jgi:two-component system, chemotaxis family, chemotaxis protein CheY
MTDEIPSRTTRILMVDQDFDLRVGLGLMLMSVGHEVEHADSGAEAILKHQRNAFDVIVTELLMPEIDGLELMLALKDQPHFPKFIFLFKESRISAEVHQRIIHRLGVRHVLTKPFPPERLLSAVEQLLTEI